MLLWQWDRWRVVMMTVNQQVLTLWITLGKATRYGSDFMQGHIAFARSLRLFSHSVQRKPSSCDGIPMINVVLLTGAVVVIINMLTMHRTNHEIYTPQTLNSCNVLICQTSAPCPLPFRHHKQHYKSCPSVCVSICMVWTPKLKTKRCRNRTKLMWTGVTNVPVFSSKEKDQCHTSDIKNLQKMTSSRIRVHSLGLTNHSVLKLQVTTGRLLHYHHHHHHHHHGHSRPATHQH